jgi:hypothetical protein
MCLHWGASTRGDQLATGSSARARRQTDRTTTRPPLLSKTFGVVRTTGFDSRGSFPLKRGTGRQKFGGGSESTAFDWLSPKP